MKDDQMQKKIAIVTKKLSMGGCEKALVSMLKVLPKDKYKVTLFIMFKGGDLFHEIPRSIDVKFIPCVSENSKSIITGYLKKKEIKKSFEAFYYLSRIKSKSYYKQYFYHTKSIPDIEGKFDLAISYFAPCEYPDWFTVNNIRASKKAVWIHSDVSKFKGIDTKLNLRMYSNFDVIFGVSRDACNAFKEKFPELSSRVETFYNIITKEEIKLKATKGIGFDDEFNGTRILTVGRLSKEKGQDIIPAILKKLLKEGYNVKWYCIGDGKLKKEIEDKIFEYHLEGRLILLGVKENPYSYIKNCDIYVQPSRYEGYCITLAEAKALDIPIITTDFAGAKEQIENEENGLITRLDEKELFLAIKRLIVNSDLRYQFREKLKTQNINTTSEIEKLEECFI